MKRRFIRAASGSVSLAVLAGMATPAAGTANRIGGNAVVVNDCLFRDLSRTNGEPAIQAGIEYNHASGWYLGAWASHVSWLSDTTTVAAPLSSSLEVDLYTGHRGSFGSEWSYDLGLYEYAYPGDYPAGFTRPYTTEGYVSLAYQSMLLKYSYSFTNFFGIPRSRHSATSTGHGTTSSAPTGLSTCTGPPRRCRRAWLFLVRLEPGRGQDLRSWLFGRAL